MRLYRILSLLLDYPDDYLKDHLPDLAGLIEADPAVSPAERRTVLETIDWMRATGLLALQAHYVQVFDLTPDHSLHLTHHTLGESRERGPALVELAEFYRAHGFEAAERELPDYLPLVLEFATTLDEAGVAVFLRDRAPVLALLAERLAAAHSPYAGLVQVLAHRARVDEAAVL